MASGSSCTTLAQLAGGLPATSSAMHWQSGLPNGS